MPATTLKLETRHARTHADDMATLALTVCVFGLLACLQLLGAGAYGAVAPATLTLETGEVCNVAVKVIRAPLLQHPADAKRVLRELKIMRHLQGHPNVIRLLDVLVSPEEEGANFEQVRGN